MLINKGLALSASEGICLLANSLDLVIVTALTNNIEFEGLLVFL